MDKTKLKIIGVAGTNGSGKDTLGLLMAKHHNYLFISVTELLREECAKRGIPASRENLRMVSAEWRRADGLGVLVSRAVKEYQKSSDKYAGVIMASLRNPGEANEVHRLGGIVIWLDADSKLRFERIKKSAEHRSHRAHEDDKTYEEFLSEEEAEMHSSGDAATLDMAAVKELADIHLHNTGESTEVFKKQFEDALGLD